MSEVIIDYNSVNDDVGNWTTENNSCDSTNNTYAVSGVTKNENEVERTHTLTFLTNDNSVSEGAISKVEVGIECYSQANNAIKIEIIPIFGGSTDGSRYSTAYTTTSDVTYWIDITSDGEAPGTWVWSDVNNLDIRLNGFNYSSDLYSTNIDQVYLRVTYGVTGWTGKFMGVTNPAKILGVSVANISKVCGIASA